MKKSAVVIIAVLLIGLCVAPASFASPKSSIVGSWTSGDSADHPAILWTFNEGGTLTSAGNSANFSGGHGSWEKIGHRTYSAVNIAFIYSANGQAELLLENRATFEVSHNGETFDAAFESTVKTLDGTPVQTVSGTAVGQRIN